MGGLFSAPKPIIITPDASVVAAATTNSPDPDAVASDARIAAQEAARRGLAGTVTTSERGLLAAEPAIAASRKSLLGE